MTEKLGRYEILEEIGRGGFAIVYRARDTQLDRSVAVKIPRKGQLDPQETEQFLREARAAVKLRHPNIAELYDFTVADDGLGILPQRRNEGKLGRHALRVLLHQVDEELAGKGRVLHRASGLA